MDTGKFEYLETIRETIEEGLHEELKDYVEVIRLRVEHDPDFKEILLEIGKQKYQHVISLIDDLIYREMQEDFEAHNGNGEGEDEILTDEDIGKLTLEMDLDVDAEEEISFEPFDENGFTDRGDDENY